MKTTKEALFTVCNLGYLRKALALAESIHRFDESRLKIFVFDSERSVTYNEDIAEIIWIENIAPTNFFQLAFKYNVIELTTALKPFLAVHLSKLYDRVIYFDPDILIFDSLFPIRQELERGDFLITPHILSREYSAQKNLNYQRFGFYNLGFFAFNSSSDTLDLLDWWWEQCRDYCYDETHLGSFTDQRWMSLAPFYFKNIIVLDHIGLNVAWWNLYERKIILRDGCYYVELNGKLDRLIFYHYSAFDGESSISKHQFDLGQNNIGTLEVLTEYYSDSLQRNNVSGDLRYSYDFFRDGSYINATLRRAYASKIDSFLEILNPFEKQYAIQSFIRKNHLKSKNSVNLSLVGFDHVSKYRRFLRLYFWILRIVLRLAGPNKFIALNRLITYSSSLIRAKDYWR